MVLMYAQIVCAGCNSSEVLKLLSSYESYQYAPPPPDPGELTLIHH